MILVSMLIMTEGVHVRQADTFMLLVSMLIIREGGHYRSRAAGAFMIPVSMFLGTVTLVMILVSILIIREGMIMIRVIIIIIVEIGLLIGYVLS